MNSVASSTQSAEFRVPVKIGSVGRLFGIPFLAVGLYILWFSVLGIAEGVLALFRGSPDVAGLLGPLLGVGIGSLFAAPGVGLAFLTGETVVDRARRQVRQTKRILGYTWGTTVAFNELDYVEKRWERSSSSSTTSLDSERDRPTASYAVRLVSTNGKRIFIDNFSESSEAEAKECAARLAELTGVRLREVDGE